MKDAWHSIAFLLWDMKCHLSQECRMLLIWSPSLFQTHHGSFLQTAECLVVGELATKDMVVVLNKVDQLPEEGRSKVINKAKKRLRQTLGSTKFGGCAMVPTAVKPGT